MHNKIMQITSYVLICTRIVIFLIIEFSNVSVVDIKVEYFLNISIILVMSYIMCKFNSKKRRRIIFISILLLNTIYYMFLDLLYEPTQKLYFQSPTKEVVLLVEVDKEKKLCGREVNVYERYLGILKKPICIHEILISDYTNIKVKWINEGKIE